MSAVYKWYFRAVWIGWGALWIW